MATAVNHLPECELSTGVYDDRADCICDALRACEQRLIREGRTRGSGVWHDGYELGFDDGVVAAEVADGSVRVPSSMVARLADANRVFEEARQAEVDRAAGDNKGTGRRVAKVAVLGVVGAGLILGGSIVGTQGGQAATTAAKTTTITAVAPVKNTCPVGFVLKKATKANTARTKNGKLVIIKKGGKICLPGSVPVVGVVNGGSTSVQAGDGYVAIKNAKGEYTVPKNFPAAGTATVADIKSLGLGPDSKVDPNLFDGPNPRIVMPDRPLVKAVAPTIVVDKSVPPVVTGSGDGTMVEYWATVSGGAGVILSGGTYHELGGTQRLKFRTSGTVDPSGQNVAISVRATAVDDLGQTALPQTVAENWLSRAGLASSARTPEAINPTSMTWA